MNRISKLWEGIRRVFAEAGFAEAAAAVQRTMAMSVLMGKVYDALRVVNKDAYKIGSDGYAYTDWDTYLSWMDLYYDDSGALFVLCTRGGKLFRIPVTISGDDVTLGDPVEIPLTGRSVRSTFRVMRTPEGKRRWLATAASSVLNRVGEIDSTALFDSFIAYAERTGEYPVLCFYHEFGVIRFGVADFLARDEYLYIASGEFDETELARAAADGLERSTEDWGTSIGFFPTSEPELMEVGGAQIPVYTEGVNHEISVVLEREAAAHFTSISTQEVNRIMDKSTRDKLAKLVGDELADAQAAADEETNRAITASGMIARENAPTDAVTVPASESISVATMPAGDANATTAAPAIVSAELQTRETAPAVVELSDEDFGALAELLAQKLQPQFEAQTQTLTELGARVGALEAGVAEVRTAQLDAQTTLETRVGALEQDERTKKTEWLADLPTQRKVITLRPRDARAPVDGNGQPVEPASSQIAANTLSGMKTVARPQ